MGQAVFYGVMEMLMIKGKVNTAVCCAKVIEEEAIEQSRRLGSQNVILRAAKPVDDPGASARDNWLSVYGLLYADADRISETIPTVVRTVPVKCIEKRGRLRARMMDLRLIGTTEAWFELVDRPVLAGRVLRREDLARSAPVAVLTEYGARRLLATEHALGETLTIGEHAYEIVGIVRSEDAGESAMQTPDAQTDAYVPLTTARERYGDVFVKSSQGARIREQVELHQILVSVDEEEHVEATAAALERVLAAYHRKKDYTVSVPLALLRQAQATRRTFSIVLGAIAGISLLVGGIGIMNIMLATVTERTREIGIRRAIGARRSQIVMQFLIESLVLSALGGLIGLGLGLLIPALVTAFAGMPTIVTAWSLLLSFGISVAVGMVFGIYPALRASRLDPIVALRHE